MNIVIHRYNNICEPDFIRAFETLGLTVIEDREEMTRKSIPGEERIRTMGTLILEQHPLFVFTVNFFPYISEICERLHVLYLSATTDCPVEEIFDPAIRNACNRVFLFDGEQYRAVRDENPDRIFHLPLGVDTERIDGEIGAFADFCGHEQYDCDLSFVGSLYNEPHRKPEDRETSRERIDLLNALAAGLPEYRVHLYTRSDTAALHGVVCHGGVKTHGEMPAVFRRSRVNLHTTMRDIRTGLPQRIWDVLGSGGFLLSNAQAEIPDYLQIGKHLDVWEDEREAIEKTRWWLAHEEERQEIARAGYLEVRAHHRVLDRVVTMMQLSLGEDRR
ncbi:MAG: DUF3880 domain-containing protein [Lachnospiraceae bacterium]|nr:DUF3880 domain-containing protein [Lachnospiraceae bacterium]